MITLAPTHPASLALGAARIALKATHNPVAAVLCGDVVQHATASRDVVAEIATDAGYLLERIQAAARDGRVSAAERAELLTLAREIQAEATTGRIQSRADQP